MITINIVAICGKAWKFLKRHFLRRFGKLPKVEPIFDEEGFVRFCYDVLPIDKRIENTKAEIEMLEAKIEGVATCLQHAQSELSKEHTEEECENIKFSQKALTKIMQESQAQLSRSRARLNEIEAYKDVEPDSYSMKQASNDFAQIREMRGVHQIFVDGDTLKIYVRASFQYKSLIYDLGDYVVKISPSGYFRAIRCRGNRGYGSYGFCFGEQYYAINDYICMGRIVEAVELMIECINYINVGDRKSISKNYSVIGRVSKEERKE